MGDLNRPLLVRGYTLALIAIVLIPTCLASCSYPNDLRGIWYTSHEKNAELTWLAGNVSTFEYTTTGSTFSDLTYECFIKEGNFYVSKTTDTIDIFGAPFYVYTCWVFSKKSSNKYLYRQAVSQEAKVDGARVKVFTAAISITQASQICDDTDYEQNQYSILLRNGTASSQKVTCPRTLLATGRYTITDDGGTTYCDDNSWIDVCTDKSTITANYTICSTNIFYSSEGELYCMYSTGFGESGVYYTTLWNTEANPDESSTYYFICAVSDIRSDGVYVSYYPGDCLNSTYQNATYISESTGFTAVIQTNTTCAPTSSENNLALILGIVFGLLFLIFLIIILCYIYYEKVYMAKKKRTSRAGSKVVPDTLPNTSMSTGDKNYRMMFTPAPPKSAVPGGRHHDYRDHGQFGSQTSMHPPVSQLAFYRTPTPRITDSKVEEQSTTSNTTTSTTTNSQTNNNPTGVELVNEESQSSSEPVSHPETNTGPHAGDHLASTINNSSDSTAPPISEQNSSTGNNTQAKTDAETKLKSNEQSPGTKPPPVPGNLAPIKEGQEKNSNVQNGNVARKMSASSTRSRPQSRTMISAKIGSGKK